MELLEPGRFYRRAARFSRNLILSRQRRARSRRRDDFRIRHHDQPFVHHLIERDDRAHQPEAPPPSAGELLPSFTGYFRRFSTEEYGKVILISDMISVLLLLLTSKTT